MGHLDPIVEQVRRESEDKIRFEFEQTFMFYLPRICEHCLNPSCMASCPSGAIYKRAEDGIVLVDQDRCRGWRQCITGCPYKKIYFNHKTGKAEKCTFCYPRVEVGPADGLLGDLRRAAALPRPVPVRRRPRSPRRRPSPDEQDLYEAQLDLMLDPDDPAVIAAAREQGIPDGLARRRPALPGLRAGQDATGSRCRCTRSTARCRWSGTSRRSRRSSTCCASRATTPRTAATCSAPSRRCGSRSSTSPSCSPPATPTSSPTCCASSPRCGPTCADITLGREPRRSRSPRRSG